MQVEVRVPKINNDLVPGDIIQSGNAFYLVIELPDNQGYVARSLNGTTGLFGVHDTLQQFNKVFENHKSSSWNVYKSSEYKLQLVRKEVK